MITILDCYTDEPSGLGVPPYLGTYPRYLYGALAEEKPRYVTIDDLRLHIFKDQLSSKKKTDIRVKNTTVNYPRIKEILDKTRQLVVVGGVHTPGKYLSAVPGTFYEIRKLIENLKCEKILTGPAAYGSRLEGGKRAEATDISFFDEVDPDYLGIDDYDMIPKYAACGVPIVKQIPWSIMAEIETARGCTYGKCSFCTEPLKHRFEKRKIDYIIKEVKALKKVGVEHFRIGKQSDFFLSTAAEIKRLLSNIRTKTLHIDNIDPVSVTAEKVKLVVKYCTSGNVAALGVESFDPKVIESNMLHSSPEVSMDAIRLINKFGSIRGGNGLPLFIPGVNILFGLIDESRETHEWNMKYLKQIFRENLFLRRINIRQVAIFPGTQLERDCGTRFLRKNKRYYWKWRDEIRQKIDNPMLKRLVPEGTVLKEVFMEVHDGNHTFGRQFGTYPLVVGVNQRLELGRSYDIRITGHMLRSVTGVVI